MNTKHLNQAELAGRWNISPRTLERWRWVGEGPPYLKVGKRIAYRLADIERYEDECRRDSTTHQIGQAAAEVV